jgi:hypothetical protein
MEHYVFAVLKRDETVAAAWPVALAYPSAAWSRVAELAKNTDQPGGRIRVTNESGDVLVLVGVAAARRIVTDVAA